MHDYQQGSAIGSSLEKTSTTSSLFEFLNRFEAEVSRTHELGLRLHRIMDQLYGDTPQADSINKVKAAQPSALLPRLEQTLEGLRYNCSDLEHSVTALETLTGIK